MAVTTPAPVVVAVTTPAPVVMAVTTPAPVVMTVTTPAPVVMAVTTQTPTITPTPVQLSIDSPMTAQQVHAFLQSDPSVVIIDTRATDEYTGVVAAGASVGHIPGAYSVPDDGNAAAHLNRFPDKTLPYICYCDTAACAHAGNVATIMILAGYTNVTYMSGGIALWTAQGYSLVTGDVTP
jgi:rhodanese-related sulfurtransferase